MKDIKSISYNPPLGYRRVIVDGEVTIMPDEKSDAIKEAFSLYADNDVSISFVANYISNKYSFPIARSTLHKSLRNEFYIGKLVYMGNKYAHDYPTFIDKNIFITIQKKIAEKVRYRRPKKFIRFLYRGLIRCGVCPSILIAERAKKKYHYYRCARPYEKHPHKPIKSEYITETISPLLKKFGVEKEVLGNLFKIRRFFTLVFSSIYTTEKGLLKYHIHKNALDLDIKAFLNYSTLPLKHSEHEKNAFNKSKKLEDKENLILKLCVIPKSLDNICDELKIDIDKAQADLMDLQLSDLVYETESGLWKTK